MTRENFKLEQQITRHIAGFETIGSGDNLVVLGRNSAMRALLSRSSEPSKCDVFMSLITAPISSLFTAR